MPAIECEPLAPRSSRLTVMHAGHRACFDSVLGWLGSDPGFQLAFGDAIASTQSQAVCWEAPPVDAEALSDPFESVVIDRPTLDRAADPSAFAAHFEAMTGSVVTFPNLGRDAVLVVPTPVGDRACYTHLVSFLRGAPESQRRELWSAVAAAMAQRVGEKPVWLSTAGGGVPWLHVRLDDRPKYYHHKPYREPLRGKRSWSLFGG